MSDPATRAYYEAEAALGTRTPPTGGPRAALRDEFCALLAAEARSSLIDFGAGPATEGALFRAAGVDYLGVDVAVANARVAAADGHRVVPADLTALPLRSAHFGAGWSMSTLMHLSASAAARAVREMARVLEPDAPLWIGLWGGDDGVRHDSTIEGQQRTFHSRTAQHNAELLGANLRIVDLDLWQIGEAEYQVFRLRVPN